MIYYALLAHYINDFIGQSLLFPKLEIGKNKSKSWKVLLLHICLYTIGMTMMVGPFVNNWALFALINGSSHLAIDAISSRISSDAWRKQNIPLFWAIIGLDQLLHTVILIASVS